MLLLTSRGYYLVNRESESGSCCLTNDGCYSVNVNEGVGVVDLLLTSNGCYSVSNASQESGALHGCTLGQKREFRHGCCYVVNRKRMVVIMSAVGKMVLIGQQCMRLNGYLPLVNSEINCFVQQ